MTQALRPLGYEQLGAGIAAATALTVPAGTSLIVMKPSAQAIRFRDDGTDPTAAVGYPLAVGVEYRYESSNPSLVKVIEQAAGAILDVLYYG